MTYSPDSVSPRSRIWKEFDSVVMLTWSDWKTEPRSNRYHYATRFAQQVPVFFVQPDSPDSLISVETVDVGAPFLLTIVHCPSDYGVLAMRRLEEKLASLGSRRPVLWVYNVWFVAYVARTHSRMVVYHATEDYVSPPDRWSVTAADLSADVRKMIAVVDLIVAVSDGVAASYRNHGASDCPIFVVPNGCDFSFWEQTGASKWQPADSGRPVALYQGGINDRLDFDLIERLIDLLPAWEFWFCGRVQPGLKAWKNLVARPRVTYFGELDPSGVAELCRRSRVGLIPFKQDALIRGSLPLKAFEYVACALPVISVPIDALETRPELFATAADAIGFAVAIQKLAPTREEPSAIAQRLAEAKLQSYEHRFEMLSAELERFVHRQRSRPVTELNVLMLYDDQSTHVGTIKEHLEAFKRYSRHAFVFMPATGFVRGVDDLSTLPDLEIFDAVAVHYSVRLSIRNHLSTGVASMLQCFRGAKLLFIQDEYDTTDISRRWIEKLGIDAVFTNVPIDQVGKVYPTSRFSAVDFLPTLTGYVPEDPEIDRFVTPIADRKVRIGYRGRILPHHYGRLGFEKYIIGVEMKRRAADVGVEVDIEVDDRKRIYGGDWYRFLGSCRATLGTESGSNVFDDDGTLAQLSVSHKDLAFEDFERRFLHGVEGRVRMNQVSPKIFEAIRLRTALVLFEGSYSGVVQPGRHYIPLRKDFSNADEVFAQLEDIECLEGLTRRAYDEVIASGHYSYRAFVEEIDNYLSARCPRGARSIVISAPKLVRSRGSRQFELCGAFGPLLSSSILVASKMSRDEVLKAQGGTSPSAVRAKGEVAGKLHKRARDILARVWHLLPAPIRYSLANFMFKVWGR